MTEQEANAEYHRLAAKRDETRVLMLQGKKTRRAWDIASNKAHKAFMTWWKLSCQARLK